MAKMATLETREDVVTSAPKADRVLPRERTLQGIRPVVDLVLRHTLHEEARALGKVTAEIRMLLALRRSHVQLVHGTHARRLCREARLAAGEVEVPPLLVAVAAGA